MIRPGVLLLVGGGLLNGCGPSNYLNQNDQLRSQNLQLQREVSELRQNLDRRLNQIDSLQQQTTRSSGPLAGARQPMLSSLAFGRYSGPVDQEGDGRTDVIRIYLLPLDQKGRLLPVAGKARVRAVAIPPRGEPVVVADRVYDPEQFEDAWRSGFFGSHYTLELKLPASLPRVAREADQWTVKVMFLQAGTGAKLTAQKAMKIEDSES